MDNDPIKKVENLTRQVNDYMELRGKDVLSRYPILFSFLATFGLVSVIYGFERIIDGIPFLNNHPFLILILGVGILIFTGSLFKHFKSGPLEK
ncbi:MAG: hypothetical protein Q7S34_00975 [bacterium]|nr:hypothetical protein [bacterium]